LETSKYFDTWVISREGPFAAEIRQYLAQHGPLPGLQFVFVPKSPVERLLDKIWIFAYLTYNLWQRRALRVARTLHEQVRFDLVHQCTFAGYREPGYMWKLDVPFAWGPIGGTQNFPWRFLGEAGFPTVLWEMLRNIVNSLQLRFSRRVRRAARKASLLLAANSTIQRDFARRVGVTPQLLPDAGIRSVIASPKRSPQGRKLRILSCGVLEGWKGVSLLIRALPLLERVPCEVVIIGRGSRRKRWQRLARQLAVADRITWLGGISHPETLQEFAKADLFVFTSLRDTMGTVLLEALSAALPVVCLDHQGAADVVTDQCGIKVPVTCPREVVAGLAEAVAAISVDPARYERLSAGALRRAAEYLWTRNGERMASCYREVLGDA
jgi:glycosyltransferase involved in cell wall biosynthesis